MNRIEYESAFSETMQQLRNGGGFLTVQSGDDLNTMTIGWALVGYIWGKPVMTVAVRRSRHTYSIIERSREFTVSVPTIPMSAALSLCGTKSGRDMNKLETAGLEIFPGLRVKVPIIHVAGIHYECRIVYKSPMGGKNLAPEYAHLYPSRDYHTIYYGHIIECYSTDEAEK